MTAGTLKRKYRWAFQGFDNDGKILFPEGFVKISNRPAFPYMAVADESGGKIVPAPGEFRITQFFTMYEHVGEARRCFNKFENKESGVTSALLTLHDGCGTVREKWIFTDVEMKLCPESQLEDDDDIIAEWLVSYKASRYQMVNF